jgi:hypothetical protein
MDNECGLGMDVVYWESRCICMGMVCGNVVDMLNRHGVTNASHCEIESRPNYGIVASTGHLLLRL